MNRYYFRTECLADVLNLTNLLLDEGIRFRFIADPVPYGVPPDAGIETDLPWLELRKIIDRIPDGHVMAETMNTPEGYTGQRQIGISMIERTKKEKDA